MGEAAAKNTGIKNTKKTGSYKRSIDYEIRYRFF